MHRLWEPLDLKRKPPTSYAAKFSSPYTIAAGLLHGDAGLAQFTDEAVNDPRAFALAAKVSYVINPDDEYPKNYTGHIRAEMVDGSVVEERQGQLRGGTKEPMTRENILAKATANLTFAGRKPAASGLLEDFATALFTEDAPFDGSPARHARRLIGVACMEPSLATLAPSTMVAGVAVCFVAAMLGSVSGMGAGMIVTLFITPIIGAKAVIPVISVLMLINNASRVWFYREGLQLQKVGLIAGVAVPMSALGALVYVRLEGALVQVLLGLMLIASIPIRRWIEGQKITPSRPQIVAVSGVFGFLSSVIVGAGMLVIPMLMGLGLTGPALLATDGMIAVLVNVAKVIFFGSLDALSLQLFLLAVAMGLCTVPGTWAGAWLVRRTSVKVHTIFIEALIVLGGASLIWSAIRT